MGNGARGWKGADSGRAQHGGDSSNRYGALANGGSPNKDKEPVQRPGFANGGNDIPHRPDMRIKILEKKSPGASEKPKLTIDKLEKEAKATLEEFYGLKDLSEATECIRDLDIKDAAHEAHLVNYCLCEAVEGKVEEQKLVMDFLAKLYEEKLLRQPSWNAGMTEFLGLYEDLLIDIPRLPTIAGCWLARAVTEEFSDLEAVGKLIEHLVASGRAERLVGEVLMGILRERDEAGVKQACAKSRFRVSSCLKGGDEGLGSFLEKFSSLRFLYPLLGIEERISELIANSAETSEGLTQWIEEHVDAASRESVEFASILSRAVLRSVVHKTITVADPTLDPDRTFVVNEHKELQRWTGVLSKYLAAEDMQVAYMLEVQRIAHDAKFPKGLMQRMFHLAYNDDIIGEDAVEMWAEHDSDDIPGKRESLFQLMSWLTWLREADSESDNDESDDGGDGDGDETSDAP